MADLFASVEMALGYARSRPPLHALILERACAPSAPAGRALDLGCGSGLSTAPLLRYARHVTGLDPNVKMLRVAAGVAPGAAYVAAAAEEMPFPEGCFDLVAAAGSLNFTDFDRSFPEVRRVLAPSGRLLIYDFAMGCEFPDSEALAAWHDEFKRRYPSPPARAIDPPSLDVAPYGLRLDLHDPFTLSLTLPPAFYLDYAMTETNVSSAIAAGTPEAVIRHWCETTLAPVFDARPREVLFRGYAATCR